MGILGGAIGAGLGVVGGIFGGISASKAMKKVKKNLQAQKRENQDWYNRNYHEDATQRAEAQAMIKHTEDAFRQRNRAAAGAAAVMGSTEEGVAATKAANAQALADTAAQIAVNGDRRKDAVDQQYRQREAGLDDALNNLEAAKASNVSQAIQGVAQTGANIADLI